MTYRAEAAYHQPIHYLRFLIGMEEAGFLTPEQAGVRNRTWEVQRLYRAAYITQGDGSKAEFDILPGWDHQVPFLVNGVRLVERLAIVTDFEESVPKRLSNDGPGDRDLLMVPDTGPSRGSGTCRARLPLPGASRGRGIPRLRG